MVPPPEPAAQTGTVMHLLAGSVWRRSHVPSSIALDPRVAAFAARVISVRVMCYYTEFAAHAVANLLQPEVRC